MSRIKYSDSAIQSIKDRIQIPTTFGYRRYFAPRRTLMINWVCGNTYTSSSIDSDSFYEHTLKKWCSTRWKPIHTWIFKQILLKFQRNIHSSCTVYDWPSSGNSVSLGNKHPKAFGIVFGIQFTIKSRLFQKPGLRFCKTWGWDLNSLFKWMYSYHVLEVMTSPFQRAYWPLEPTRI